MESKNENEISNREVDISEVKHRKRRSKIILLVLIFVITNIMSLYIGSSLRLLETAKFGITSSKYNEFFTVRSLLEKYYYKNINEDKLVEGSIKGMASSLNDPYTVYMNEDEYREFSTNTTGTYIGIGLQVGVKDNSIVVIAPFDNSPAKKAGIQSGDIIVKVNGKALTGKDLDTAVNMMKGKAGETVAITLSRKGKGEFNVNVKREPILMQTVKYEMLQDKIGYIQLTMFDEKTDGEFIKAVQSLKKAGMKGLILDLRDNPGGLLTTCVNISSQFIPKGKVIVSTKDKAGNEEKEYSNGGSTLMGMPLVVLVNGGTASASEILSGVVRDYKLGTLIGTKTFGKGVVQAVLDSTREPALKSGTALKVTIAKYYTPSGENIDKIGIKPNIEVTYPDALKTKPYSRATDPQFIKALEVLKTKMK